MNIHYYQWYHGKENIASPPPLATLIITMSLCLFFSIFLVKSVHAEDIYEANYGTYDSSLYSDVTEIINSDFIIRAGGSFRYLRYPVSRTTVDGDSQKKSFNYLGAGPMCQDSCQ